MVREFQSVIGREVIHQIRTYQSEDPNALVACVGGGIERHWSFRAVLRPQKSAVFWGGSRGGDNFRATPPLFARAVPGFYTGPILM